MPVRSDNKTEESSLSRMIEMPGLDQIPDDYWKWLKEQEEQEMSQDYAGQNASGLPSQEARDVPITRLRQAEEYSRRLHRTLDRLEDVLARAGLGSGRGPTPPEAPKPADDKLSLSEISMALPGRIDSASTRVGGFIDLIDTELL